MKNWPSQIFPLVFLTLLAGLSFWLQSSVDHDEPRSNSKQHHNPDAYAENFSVRRFDAAGQLKYRLTSPSLIHYADDESSELESPILTSYSPNAAPVTITGDHARMTAKGETVFLWDNVIITRSATPQQPEIVARTQDLTSQTEAEIAFTHRPVEITQGQSWLKGTGLRIDNKLSTLELQSQVTGLYIRPRATQ